MRMLPADIRRYPKLAFYVRINLPQVMKVPAIVKAMNSIANLNQAQLRTALQWGIGPVIKITNLSGNYGEFSPGVKSNEIRINTALVTDFENGLGRRMSKSGNVSLVGVTLLHELVHWGDDQNGIDRPGEEGEEFERLVYGSVIN